MQNSNKPKKLKVVLLGNRAVGKSSIIRRFVFNEFPQEIQVFLHLPSLLLLSITCRKLFPTKVPSIDYNYGILLDRKNIDL